MKLLVPLFVALALCGCSDPRSAVIPADTNAWESQLKPKLERLSDEEKRLVGAYILRAKLGEAFGATDKLGKITIGEAIEEQRLFEVEEKKRAEEQERKDREARELKDRLERQKKERLDQMSQALAVAFLSKEIKPANMDTWQISDLLVLRLGFKNKGGKPIKGVKGAAIFKNMFGDQVARIGVDFQQDVAVGKEVAWEGALDFNQFDDEHKALQSIPIEKLSFTFEPDVIVFGDGSKLSAEEAETPSP